MLGVLEVAGNPPAGEDGPQVHGTTELFSCFIQATPQSIAPVFGVYKHIQAVKRIAVGVVPDFFVTQNQVVVGVRVAESFVFHAYRERHRHQLAVVFDTDLAIRELFYQRLDGVFWPRATNVVVNPIHQLLQLAVVIKGQVTQIQVELFMGHRVLPVVSGECAVISAF